MCLQQFLVSPRPGLISALDSYHISAVSCGHTHTVAIDNQGMLFAWGDNNFGQLGSVTKSTTKFYPT